MWFSGAIESRHNCDNVCARNNRLANNVCKDHLTRTNSSGVKKRDRGLDRDQQYKLKL